LGILCFCSRCGGGDPRRVEVDKEQTLDDDINIKDDTKNDAHVKEKAHGDTIASAKLQVIFCLKVTKPARPQTLEIAGPVYDYYVRTQDIMGASHFTMTGASDEDLHAEKGMTFDGSRSKSQFVSTSRFANSVGAGLKSTAVTNDDTEGSREEVHAQKASVDDDFARVQLETFLPLLFPFKINEAAAAGLLILSPNEVRTQERRIMVTKSITMPDVFLSWSLVPKLVPQCQIGSSSDLLTKLSAHTLYLFLMAFTAPKPNSGSREELETERKLGQFQRILEQFRTKFKRALQMKT